MEGNVGDSTSQVKRKRNGGGRRPAIEVGQVLTRAQVLYREKIGSDTLDAWVEAGLQFYKPPRMGSTVTTGQDVLDFIRQFPVGKAAQPKPATKPRKRKEK